MEYKNLREKFYLKVKEYLTYKFKVHLVIYAFVNSFFAFVNLYYTPKYIWFIYPLFFWGMGLTLHYLSINFSAERYVRFLDECVAEESKVNISEIKE